jgi:hypothetical protein
MTTIKFICASFIINRAINEVFFRIIVYLRADATEQHARRSRRSLLTGEFRRLAISTNNAPFAGRTD